MFENDKKKDILRCILKISVYVLLILLLIDTANILEYYNSLSYAFIILIIILLDDNKIKTSIKINE